AIQPGPHGAAGGAGTIAREISGPLFCGQLPEWPGDRHLRRAGSESSRRNPRELRELSSSSSGLTRYSLTYQIKRRVCGGCAVLQRAGGGGCAIAAGRVDEQHQGLVRAERARARGVGIRGLRQAGVARDQVATDGEIVAALRSIGRRRASYYVVDQAGVRRARSAAGRATWAQRRQGGIRPR